MLSIYHVSGGDDTNFGQIFRSRNFSIFITIYCLYINIYGFFYPFFGLVQDCFGERNGQTWSNPRFEPNTKWLECNNRWNMLLLDKWYVSKCIYKNNRYYFIKYINSYYFSFTFDLIYYKNIKTQFFFFFYIIYIY